jgi:hypothetical protein
VVTAKPHGNQNKDEEANVWVVTQGGVQTGVDLECGESSCQNIERKIRKFVPAPPKFDTM